jgi:hypothetical protein
MDFGVYLFLNLRKAPTASELHDGVLLVAKGRDLAVVRWDTSFADLTDPEESAETLWVTLGSLLLEKHRDPKGILVIDARSSQKPPQAQTYAAAIAAHGAKGRWLKNVALEPGGSLEAARRSDVPLPDMPTSKRGEFYVLSPARAMRELGLTAEPLRVVRFELFVKAPPAKVSEFYSPLLKTRGFKVKRRIWSDGSAEQLVGTSSAFDAVVHAEAAERRATFVQVSWIEKK